MRHGFAGTPVTFVDIAPPSLQPKAGTNMDGDDVHDCVHLAH